MDEDKYGKYDSLPIPTYEEAISSRPSSSQTNLGAQETSDDAERQGLLGAGPRASNRRADYQRPTVESARNSLDSDLSIPEMVDEDDEAEASSLRRDMEEMEVMDPNTMGYVRNGSRHILSKRFNSLRHTLSGLSIPNFGFSFPSLTSITSRIPPWPENYRITLPIVARLFALGLIALLIYLLFALDIFPTSSALSQHYDPESVKARAVNEVQAPKIAENLRYITSFDHVAGTEGDFFLAEWQYESWSTAKLDEIAITDIFVYMNYPTKEGRRIAIVNDPAKDWAAALEEPNVFTANGQEKQQTLTWHAHSRAGNVTGPLVYANGGSRDDFRKLKEMGVDIKGSVVLMRYHHHLTDTAQKIKNAELEGAVGCILYTDPTDDGDLRGSTYPDGPWRPFDSVRREGVGLTSWVMGDLLTPGWTSFKIDLPRLSEIDNPGLVNIPSLPLSAKDAADLMMAQVGHGERLENDEWRSGLTIPSTWTGNSTSPTINLQNNQDENKIQQIWNVYGLIQGMEDPQKKVIVGNHRDSWCFGSIDPGSGTAVLMEVVRVFGKLRSLGWRPLRTIEFVSWDGGEYNLLGSTEYVEDKVDYLREHGVGYLNVDVGVSGPRFRAAASPLLQRPLEHAIERIGDPVAEVSLRQIWDEAGGPLEGLSAASDYAAFQHIAGTSSIDFGFEGDNLAYPAHSCYETFDWMDKFGDPGFVHHKMLAQIWILLILDLADQPILPYDLNSYAIALEGYISDLDKDGKELNLNVDSLRNALEVLTKNAAEFHAFDDFWTGEVLGRGGFESNNVAIRRIEHNDRLSRFETDLLDLPGMFEGDKDQEHGIPHRTQYKHVIFGPSSTNRYQPSYFPAVRDAIEAGDAALAQKQIDKAARILLRAAGRLLQ